ncbi:DUF4387 domain-containing protein [Salirhabdus salicampi]|uniref:DUF4387 domain-containing protein n=1 Tax=Salirhabdus salicampi TaxID=476102 RepID=UPI0020C3EBB5|nr:DUF4387 domain-containing protein [Salirhabdus salicampi]MCP8616314.1 DUF4387 domain-containing protein [Salirhabdus salicampi]
MPKLKDVAYLLRSKNAGPFFLTFDIIFEKEEDYYKVTQSKLLSKDWIANAYKCDKDQVQLFEYETIFSIKVSIPRKYASGDINDTDIFGAQQHVPIMMLEL